MAHNVSLLRISPQKHYHILCELKQTVPLLEWELTPAEIRIGRETFRPGSLKQEHRRFTWWSNEGVDDYELGGWVIRHGDQTYNVTILKHLRLITG